VIDPNTARKETSFSFDSQLIAPVADSVAVFVGGGYRETNSNLPNFELNNVFGQIGVNVRF
jgi:hypothetical protein